MGERGVRKGGGERERESKGERERETMVRQGQ